MPTLIKPELYVKQGSLKPPVAGRIWEPHPLEDWDLGGSLVTFTMWDVLANGELGTKVIDEGQARIVDAAKKIVAYDWQTGETDTPGVYHGEFWITLPSPQTNPFKVPTKDYIRIYIGESP